MTISKDDLITLILDLTPIPGLDADTVATTDELLTGGLIDSMGLMQVIDTMEKKTGRKVPASDISIDNFNSLAAILRLCDKLGAA